MHELLFQSHLNNDGLVNPQTGLGTKEDSSIFTDIQLSKWLTQNELEVLYIQNDLARQIVSEVVREAMRDGWTVKTKSGGEKVEAPDHLDVRRILLRTGVLGRLFGGSHVWLVDGDRDFTEPVDELDNIVPLTRWEAEPSEWEADPSDPNFTQPSKFQVSINKTGVSTTSKEVAQENLVYFAGHEMHDEFYFGDDYYDVSVLQAVWPPLKRFDQIEGSIAELVQSFEQSTFSIEGLDDILQDKEGRKLLEERVEIIQKSLSNIKAAIIDKSKGEEYERSFASVNGLDTLWDRFAHSVARAAKQPMTRLFGMSPSGLATDDKSGRVNWRKEVSTYRKTYVRPAVEKIYSVIAGEPVEVDFPPLDETTSEEQAKVDKTEAQAAKVLVSSGVMERDEVRDYLHDKGHNINRDEETLDEILQNDPYSGPSDPDIPSHVPKDERQLWLSVWEDVYSSSHSEGEAYKAANEAVQRETDGGDTRGDPVPGYPGYTVTRDGKVFGQHGTQLEPQPQKRGGHYEVELWKNGERETEKVHRLVMRVHGDEAPSSDHIINHKDGDVSNNHIDNLEWATRSENAEQYYENDDKDRVDVPKGVQEEAQQALEWREDPDKDTEGAGTESGWKTAEYLASGSIPRERVVQKMYPYLERSEAQEGRNEINEEYEGQPWKDDGYLTFLAWGGEPAKSFAKRIRNEEKE